MAIAGASGFIGTALTPRLADTCDVLALTRSRSRAQLSVPTPGVTWRHCDLFRASDLRSALAGVEYAVYLVHSLAPSSRLTQASARDMDLVLADNFARAAAANGVRHIVFVSAVLPRTFRCSPLLWSRREVEMVLGAHATPVTALRAGLVVGPGGTGSNLLLNLVRRLPLVVLPPASRSLTRPIALTDLVRAILHCLGRPERFAGDFDIGGPQELSYEQMLRQSAEVMGLKRRFQRLPYVPAGLVSLAARWVGGAPAHLIGAIVESLPQDTLMRDNAVQRAITPGALSFQEALATCIDPETKRPRPAPRQRIAVQDQALLRRQSLVRSIQRLNLPPGQDAAWVGGNYFRWLSTCCWPLVSCRIIGAGDRIEVWARLPRAKLLVLEHRADASTSERQVYAIVGGHLARESDGQARFEFQTLLDARYTMTAIHDYAPALPWYLYLPTQAFGHRLVMRRYQRRLARLAHH